MNNTNDAENENYVFVDEDGNEILVDDSEFERSSEELQEELDDEALIEAGLGDEVILKEEYGLRVDGSLNDPDSYEAYEDDYADEEYDSEEGSGIMGLIANRLMLVLGVTIALIAIIVGVTCFAKRGGGSKSVDFSEVGVNVAEIGAIGRDNIVAITSARGELLDALYDVVKNYDYDEADEETGITTVSVTLTSILKDLKVKFVNSKGKLIGNVPFEVEVTDSKGNTETWTDDDKDGIIYKTDLSGTYSVKLVTLSGLSEYYDFTTNSSSQSVSVKSTLDYQKVDVKNEIKSASQVSETEDAAENDTTEESKLTDTVAYVISSKTAASDGYTVIAKTQITDPVKMLTSKNEAGLARFRRLTSTGNVSGNEGGESSGGSGSESGGGSGSESGGGSGSESGGSSGSQSHEHSYVWDRNVGNGNHTLKCNVSGCDATKTETCNKTQYNSNNNGTHNIACSICGYTADTDKNATCSYTYTKKGTAADKTHSGKCSACGYEIANVACTDSGSGVCKECGGTIKEATTYSMAITESNSKTAIAVNGTATLKANVTASDSTTHSYSYSWSVTAGSESVSLSASENVLTVKGVKSGSVTIQCIATVDGESSKTVTQTFAIKVNELKISLDRTSKKALFAGYTSDGSDKFVLTATTTGGNSSDATKGNRVTWSSSDTSIATVDESETVTTEKGVSKCTVRALKAGTVTITATSDEDTSIKQSLTVVVSVHPAKDTVTKLVDASNNQVYKKDSNGKYVEATYADYYSGTNLYIVSGTTTYKYQGWWTIDGKTYYFDKNGNKVTGDQVILGAKYSFDSNGALKSGTGTFGIDVSKWNGTIDWSKVAKSGVSYAILRCGFRGSTIGGLVEDAKFATNIRNATDNGIKVGVYFFTQAVNEVEAVEEASMCLTMVEGYKLAYPIFIDVESASGGRANGLTKDERTAVIKAFCKTISNAGYKAGVYANKSWLTTKINASELTGYVIWLAQYASSPTYTATRYDIWQYSDSGSLSGISGSVDLDLSYLGY